MAGGDLGAPRAARHGSRLHRSKRRLPVRIDMTPMVDVVMLLITFFMLTTVFRRQQAMEVNVPAEDTKVEVAESNLLTLRVSAAGHLFWNLGVEAPQPIEIARLRPFLAERLTANAALITLLKVDRHSAYESMVNVMDELDLANVTRFSLAPFEDTDRDLLATVERP
jgi:biopolymer transport protein ExbD